MRFGDVLNRRMNMPNWLFNFLLAFALQWNALFKGEFLNALIGIVIVLLMFTVLDICFYKEEGAE